MGIFSCYGTSYSTETLFAPIYVFFTTPSMCLEFALS